MGKKQIKQPTLFVVNNKKYYIIKKIADGGFSTIYKVRHRGEIFALKRIGIYDVCEADKFLEEAALMRKFSTNEHIIKCIDCCTHPNENGIFEVIIVMEYCKRNLNEVILNFDKNKKHDSNYKMMIFNQICLALASFHYSHPTLIHRDIKTENILQQSENKFLLCDFGSVTSKIYDPKTTAFHVINDDIYNNTTLAYRSPEMVSQLEGKLISTKADIWALGCVLFKIYHGETPFGEAPGKIIDGFEGFPSNSSCPDDAKELIKWMLHIDPDQRPNIYDVHMKASKILNQTPKLNPMSENTTTSVENRLEFISPFDSKISENSMYSDNTGKETPKSIRQNPFGSGFISDMNFSQCREMIQQTNLVVDPSSKDEHTLKQTTNFQTPSTHSNNAEGVSSQNTSHTSNEGTHLFGNHKKLDNSKSIEFNTNLKPPSRSHSRHQSLNEKMLNLNLHGKKMNDSKSHNRNKSLCKNQFISSSHNTQTQTVAQNPFRENKAEVNFTSNDNSMFNPFENTKPSSECGQSVGRPIDSISGEGNNPFKFYSSPRQDIFSPSNPFRDDNSIQAPMEPLPIIGMKNISTEIFPISDDKVSKEMNNGSNITSSPNKLKYSNPFRSYSPPTSPFKPNGL